MGFIYKITNIIDNTSYIGQTLYDIQNRLKGHCKVSSKCRYLKNAIQKYGKDNFKIESICECANEDLNDKEKYYIEYFNTIVPNGYNLKEGGNSSRHNEETKRKISESLLLNKDRLNARAQLGKPHTKEVKLKISESVKKILNGSMPKGLASAREYLKTKWKAIIQLDTDGVFIERFENSARIADKINSNRSSIHNSCIKGSLHKGFYFMYEKDYIGEE